MFKVNKNNEKTIHFILINIDENKRKLVEEIKASDGKTYKFLGSQWAQLLPSGKTGLFAKKKIGRELDKLSTYVRQTNDWEVKAKEMPDVSFPAKTAEITSKIKDALDESSIVNVNSCVP